MRDKKQTFIEKLFECNQHKKRLLEAKNRLKGVMPLDIESYNDFESLQISIIDQMIFRFSKLQDTMGEKLFAAILDLNAEEVKKMSFIDRLNRLEELELLSKDGWMSLRKNRNEIAHEYSFNQDEVVDGINIIYKEVDNLLRIYSDICNYCFKKFDFVRESDILNFNTQEIATS